VTKTAFSKLGLYKDLLNVLGSINYIYATPIQEQAIPVILSGQDLMGIAQTGTGKTAAFGLPILQQLSSYRHNPKSRNVRALILAPTRELAIQIHKSLRIYGRDLSLRHAVIFGGVSQKKQVQDLHRGVDILVATPGRLIDLMHQKHLKLNQIEFFVLDEADRMLDMGFIRDIKNIVVKLPKVRQTLCFSATMPAMVDNLANEILNQPKRLHATPNIIPLDLIEQSVIFAASGDKLNLLIKILQNSKIIRALVFVRTKHRADRVAKTIRGAGIKSDAFHGNKSQNTRQRIFKSFRDGRINVLVATDIAARGIDIDCISHVINFELPHVAEDYVHRIGRTARAGNSGIAISLCDPSEQSILYKIEKLIKVKVNVTGGKAVNSQPAKVKHKLQKLGRSSSHRKGRGRRRTRRAA